MPPALSGLIRGLFAGLALAAAPTPAAAADDLFARDNLVAWCIVPFDGKHRGPDERAALVKALGLRRVAYDWRPQHVPEFEAEILAYQREGLDYFAFWGLHDAAFELFAKHGLTPQIWLTAPSPAGADQAARITAAVAQLRPAAERTARAGCRLGLYNHGGWGGEPENLVAVCTALHAAGFPHVGIVYNLHHGHGHVADFAACLAALKPHLLCLNLNGMGKAAKILPLGAGEHDLELLRTIRDSGYAGRIGIIGHTDDDVAERLRDNLDGLDWLVAQLDGAPPGPRLRYRTFPGAPPLKPPAAPPTPAQPAALPEVAADLAWSEAAVQAILAEARASGDARRGATVFGRATSACLSCHKVGAEGAAVGPELTRVAGCLTPEEIVEALWWPDRTVKPEYRAVAVATAAGKLLQGILREETAEGIELVDATGARHEIPAAEIDERQDVGSLMPKGLLTGMSADDRRDLVRYLLELGRTPGLESLSHRPAKLDVPRAPLVPADWPNASAHVNRDRVYDGYARQAVHFRGRAPLPLLLPPWPGLDGGRHGHWGNQNDAETWRDGRWNETDLGSLQCWNFEAGGLKVPRAVCLRLGDAGELSACFDPDTLEIVAVWQGGFLKFSDRRRGFLDAARPAGSLGTPPAPLHAKAASRVYHGLHRHGRRVLLSYAVDGVEMLDAPWAEDGRLVRVVAPAAEHPLAHLVRGGGPQWPKVIETAGTLGTGRPYAVDTIQPPFDNPWKSLLFFGGIGFFSDGAAAVCTIQGDVWRVEGLDATLERVRWRRMAAGLNRALGIVVHDDRVYVQCGDQITRLEDRDGDGEADFYAAFSRALPASTGHDYHCGLERDAAGRFYTAAHARLARISADGSRAETLAVGFRNPDGLGLLPDGTLTVPVSEGDWTPASAICEVANPAGPPNPPPDFRGRPPALPLVYLPRGLDNSAGGQIAATSDRWGPLAGQLIHLSFGACSHFLVLRDEVAGRPQGAVVPLVGDFRSGVHRGRFHPRDGQLYVCGMNGWGSYAVDDGCLQRVRFTGDRVQLPVGWRACRNGVLLTFSAPLAAAVAGDATNHFAQCWNYRHGPGYGSPEFSPSHPGTPGHDPLSIASATLVGERQLFLELPDLQPVSQLHLRVATAPGEERDVFATVHALAEPFTAIPGYRPVTRPIAAHPLERDMALLEARPPNPWRKPLAGARAVEIKAAAGLAFLPAEIGARAGEPLALTFRNPDVVPHNFVLVAPGSLASVGDAANRLVADPRAVLRHYVPESDKVVAWTDIVEPGGSQTIHFEAPRTPGRYPYLCSFPGHWMVMNGMLVVDDGPNPAATSSAPTAALPQPPASPRATSGAK